MIGNRLSQVHQVEDNTMDLSGYWTKEFIMGHKLKTDLFGKRVSLSEMVTTIWNSVTVPDNKEDNMDRNEFYSFLTASQKVKEKLFKQITSKLKVKDNTSAITFLKELAETDKLKTVMLNFMKVSDIDSQKKGFTNADLVQFAIKICEDAGVQFSLDLDTIKKMYQTEIQPMVREMVSSYKISSKSKKEPTEGDAPERTIYHKLSALYNELFKLANKCGYLYTWKSEQVNRLMGALFHPGEDNIFTVTNIFFDEVEDDVDTAVYLTNMFNEFQANNYKTNISLDKDKEYVKKEFYNDKNGERVNLYNTRVLQSNYASNSLLGARVFHKALPVARNSRISSETDTTVTKLQNSNYVKNIIDNIDRFSSTDNVKKLIKLSSQGVPNFAEGLQRLQLLPVFKNSHEFLLSVKRIAEEIINSPEVIRVIEESNKDFKWIPENKFRTGTGLLVDDEVLASLRNYVNFVKLSSSAEDTKTKFAFITIRWFADCSILLSILSLLSIQYYGSAKEMTEIFLDPDDIEDFAIDMKSKITNYNNSCRKFGYLDLGGNKIHTGITYLPSPINLGLNLDVAHHKEMYNTYVSILTGKYNPELDINESRSTEQLVTLESLLANNLDALDYLHKLKGKL